MDWPPPFTVRVSARAKRASIRISPYQEVEVVLPQSRFAPDPLSVLNDHKTWVLNNLRSNASVPVKEEFPSLIEFPGLNHQLHILYQASSSSRLTLREDFEALVLKGPTQDWPRVQAKLLNWLNLQARDLLHPQVNHLSEYHGFKIAGLSVKLMKTRWGSCNREGALSLNSLLVFLPLELIHHVILHEFCHLKYMSHGPRFWGLLTKLDPKTPVHNRALKNVQGYLPGWL